MSASATHATETVNCYVLAVRFGRDLAPGLAGGVWWMAGRDLDEGAARQRSYRTMPMVRSVDGEAVLIHCVEDLFGRAIEHKVIVRQVTATRPPMPSELKRLTSEGRAALESRVATFYAAPKSRQRAGVGALFKQLWAR